MMPQKEFLSITYAVALFPSWRASPHSNCSYHGSLARRSGIRGCLRGDIAHRVHHQPGRGRTGDREPSLPGRPAGGGADALAPLAPAARSHRRARTHPLRLSLLRRSRPPHGDGARTAPTFASFSRPNEPEPFAVVRPFDSFFLISLDM